VDRRAREFPDLRTINKVEDATVKRQLLDLHKRNTDLSKGLGRSSTRAADEKVIASGIAKAKLLLSGSALASSITTGDEVLGFLQQATSLLQHDQHQKIAVAADIGVAAVRRDAADGILCTPRSSATDDFNVLWSASAKELKARVPKKPVDAGLLQQLQQLERGTVIKVTRRNGAETTLVFEMLSGTGMIIGAADKVPGPTSQRNPRSRSIQIDPTGIQCISFADGTGASSGAGVDRDGSATPPRLTLDDIPGMATFYSIVNGEGSQVWSFHDPDAGGGIPGETLKHDGHSFAEVLIDQKYVRWCYIGDESFGRARNGAQSKPHYWSAFKQFRAQVRASEAYMCEPLSDMKEGCRLAILYDMCNQMYDGADADAEAVADANPVEDDDVNDAPEVSEDEDDM
jgi:hypothetical protein